MTPHGTTVVAVRRRGTIALASDGQTSYSNIALVTDQTDKLARLHSVIFGFCGATRATTDLEST